MIIRDFFDDVDEDDFGFVEVDLICCYGWVFFFILI